MDNRYKFDYENSDKKIEVEIFGLKFELKDLSREDIEEIKTSKEDINKIDKMLEKLLGEGAIKQIDEKREKDGYDKMNLKIKSGVLAFAFQLYCEELLSSVEGMYNRIGNAQERFNNFNRKRYNRRRY